ncbi:hypothetical protein ACIA8I_22470 [Streptomyces rishiriensis]|uniref:hypothetical protein n=1 Tax=Streptomyces rishiriensis TaxID=68264 RepID=UPI000D59FE20|nr:hypothetical protein [Streptomyces rishiriensis]
MGHWVHRFSGRPGLEDQVRIGQEDAPEPVVLRERPGELGVVDGYVRELLDEEMLVARLRWVAGGDPERVAAACARGRTAERLTQS